MKLSELFLKMEFDNYTIEIKDGVFRTVIYENENVISDTHVDLEEIEEFKKSGIIQENVKFLIAKNKKEEEEC